MVKFKTTQKEIKNGYVNIIVIGYCDIQNLLYGKSATAYTCGVYGWNADIYEVSWNTAICTGYRPFGNIRPSYELVRAYDDKARKIIHNYEVPYEKRIAKINKLFTEFIGKVFDECLTD